MGQKLITRSRSVCITSIIRLYSLKSFGLTVDPTYDNVATQIWSALEITAAMVCSSIPSIRAGATCLYRRVFGKRKGSCASMSSGTVLRKISVEISEAVDHAPPGNRSVYTGASVTTNIKGGKEPRLQHSYLHDEENVPEITQTRSK
jgi:hypothetical protein